MNPYDLNKEAAGGTPQQKPTSNTQQKSNPAPKSTPPQNSNSGQKSNSQQNSNSGTKPKPADAATSSIFNWGSLNGPLLYALLGGGIGAGAGALFTKSEPNEDKKKRVKRRLLNALILGGMGAGAGALFNKGLDFFATDPKNQRPEPTRASTMAGGVENVGDLLFSGDPEKPGIISDAFNSGLLATTAAPVHIWLAKRHFRNQRKNNIVNVSADIKNIWNNAIKTTQTNLGKLTQLSPNPTAEAVEAKNKAEAQIRQLEQLKMHGKDPIESGYARNLVNNNSESIKLVNKHVPGTSSAMTSRARAAALPVNFNPLSDRWWVRNIPGWHHHKGTLLRGGITLVPAVGLVTLGQVQAHHAQRQAQKEWDAANQQQKEQTKK